MIFHSFVILSITLVIDSLYILKKSNLTLFGVESKPPMQSFLDEEIKILLNQGFRFPPLNPYWGVVRRDYLIKSYHKKTYFWREVYMTNDRFENHKQAAQTFKIISEAGSVRFKFCGVCEADITLAYTKKDSGLPDIKINRNKLFIYIHGFLRNQPLTFLRTLSYSLGLRLPGTMDMRIPLNKCLVLNKEEINLVKKYFGKCEPKIHFIIDFINPQSNESEYSYNKYIFTENSVFLTFSHGKNKKVNQLGEISPHVDAMFQVFVKDTNGSRKIITYTFYGSNLYRFEFFDKNWKQDKNFSFSLVSSPCLNPIHKVDAALYLQNDFLYLFSGDAVYGYFIGEFFENKCARLLMKTKDFFKVSFLPSSLNGAYSCSKNKKIFLFSNQTAYQFSNFFQYDGNFVGKLEKTEKWFNIWNPVCDSEDDRSWCEE